MSFALSQRRVDRHPVGLLVVVGLHAVLAAALLSARLARKAPEPAPLVDIRPIDMPPPPPRPVATTPVPATQPFHPLVLPVPLVTPDPAPDPIVAKVDDGKPVIVASVGDDHVVHDQPARATPRAARIDAGAARCRPAYPAAAQRAGATGTTLIRFSVDATGRISATQILRASGPTRENRLMDHAAAEALAQCPVQVGTDADGHPTGTTTDVSYVWTLE